MSFSSGFFTDDDVWAETASGSENSAMSARRRGAVFMRLPMRGGAEAPRGADEVGEGGGRPVLEPQIAERELQVFAEGVRGAHAAAEIGVLARRACRIEELGLS